MIDLLQITNDPALARRCDALPGMRLFVDLEVNGKAERQAGRNTFISTHRMEDIGRIKSQLLHKSAGFVDMRRSHHTISFCQVPHHREGAVHKETLRIIFLERVSEMRLMNAMDFCPYGVRCSASHA